MKLNKLKIRLVVFVPFIFLWMAASPAVAEELEGYVSNVRVVSDWFGSKRVTFQLAVNPPASDAVSQQAYLTSISCAIDSKLILLPFEQGTKNTIKEHYALLLTARAVKAKVKVSILGCDDTGGFFRFPLATDIEY